MIAFKHWSLNEAIYKGMVGIHELIRFEHIATAAEKKSFQALLAVNKNKEALAFLEKTLGVKFQ